MSSFSENGDNHSFIMKSRVTLFYIFNLASKWSLFAISIKTNERNLFPDSFLNRIYFVSRFIAEKFIEGDAVEYDDRFRGATSQLGDGIFCGNFRHFHGFFAAAYH